MARVRFTRDYDHHIHAGALKAFKAGRGYTIKRDWADKAIAKGAAVEVIPPPAPAVRKSRRKAPAA